MTLVEKTYGESDPGWFGAKEQDFLPIGLSTWWSYLPESYQKVTAPIKKDRAKSKQTVNANLGETVENIIESGRMREIRLN